MRADAHRIQHTRDVDPAAETFVQLVAVLLVGLLILRIVMSLPGWVTRRRRPETRSILVVGVGGGGGNAVDRMVQAGTAGVGFVACNTDAQALRRSQAGTRIRIGDAITRGLGAGGDPSVGRRAAEADQDEIARALSGANLVFVTAGLGGGTGSGAAPVVAAKAKEQGALTIGVVTKPFDFEGVQRREIADEAAARLLAEVDALITVPNERIDGVIRQDASALEAFRVVDEVLLQAAEGIIDLLNTPGLINLDFADVRAVVQDAGPALIGIGRGFGPDRAIDAARQAISSPLLEASIKGARGILFHVSGPPDLRLREVRLAADEIRAAADPRANVIFGANLSGDDDDEVLITLIATGLDPNAVGTDIPAARPATLDAGSTIRPRVPAEDPVPVATHRAFTPEPRVERPPEPTATPEPERAPTLTPKPGVAARSTVPGTRRRESRRVAAVEDDLELPTFLRKVRPPTAGVR
jgi:cell division protein FtsZ